jgi:uncharacterized protein
MPLAAFVSPFATAPTSVQHVRTGTAPARRPRSHVTMKSAATRRPPPPPAPAPAPAPAPGPPPPPLKDRENGPGKQRAALLGAATAAAAVGAVFLAAFSGGGGGGDVPDVLSDGDSVRGLAAVLADPHFLVSIGLGVSAFVQTLTGFGFAIVSVGALTQIPWIAHSSVFDDIQPIAATLSGGIAWTLLLPEIRKVEWRRLTPLIAASTVATPLGAAALEYMPAAAVLKVLGGLIAGYVAFTVSGVKVPAAVGGRAGAWGMGAVAGFFGGAFDITGPALVVHGQAADWGAGFRRNLLAVVAINSTVVVACDAISGRLADFYYLDLLKFAVPAVAVGMVAGDFVSKKLDPAAFKKVVLATCFAMGVKLLLN